MSYIDYCEIDKMNFLKMIDNDMYHLVGLKVTYNKFIRNLNTYLMYSSDIILEPYVLVYLNSGTIQIYGIMKLTKSVIDNIHKDLIDIVNGIIR